MIGLTPKQAKLFAFIKARIAENGVSPSYEEMMVHNGIASKSGAHRLVTALEERQLIRRIPHRARTIEVINPDTDTLGFLSPDVLRVVVQTARANDMLPECVVARIVLQWAQSELSRPKNRRSSPLTVTETAGKSEVAG